MDMVDKSATILPNLAVVKKLLLMTQRVGGAHPNSLTLFCYPEAGPGSLCGHPKLASFVQIGPATFRPLLHPFNLVRHPLSV
jgi:hypothetical protein